MGIGWSIAQIDFLTTSFHRQCICDYRSPFRRNCYSKIAHNHVESQEARFDFC